MKKTKKLIVLFALANVFLFVLLFSSATWSWLSVGIGSSSNVINLTHFSFDVEVVKDGENINVITGTGSKYGYFVKLESSGKYTITIKLTDASNAQNGYCKISAMNDNSLTKNYYKNIIFQGKLDVLTFEIETKETNVDLLLIPSLGIASTNSFETSEAYLEINFNN
jgi:hypothetical protein